MYTNSSRSYLKMASGTPRRTNGTPWRTGGTPTAEYSFSLLQYFSKLSDSKRKRHRIAGPNIIVFQPNPIYIIPCTKIAIIE